MDQPINTKPVPKSIEIYCNWCGKAKQLEVFRESLSKIRFCSRRCKGKHQAFMCRADTDKKEERKKRHLAYWHKIGKDKRQARRKARQEAFKAKHPELAPLLDMFAK